jgi:LuxR family maltose regulon positive regulatory protein
LNERLNEGLLASRKLTLIAAPAGFGKTTLISEWVIESKIPAAWLSLDEGDNDLTRFLMYFIAALQTFRPAIGAGLLGTLQSPQPPSMEAILSILIDEIATIPDQFVFVFDDYHSIDSKPVDKALTFLIEHLPPQMSLIIATSKDPNLPLARLRARDQLTELRAADLQFTKAETAEFLNQVMGLNLTVEDVAALETRTEGWIAGLQLAAISMQGHPDSASFIRSFTGSHHFVLDYLVEEVLQQQPESVQTFLLRTSILGRLCGPLCDAVLLAPSGSGQATLEYLERANLFIVPLDNERRWYRYHHVFADLLQQRLQKTIPHDHQVSSERASSLGDDGQGITTLHVRASVWCEENGMDIEAFQHAAAANDVVRAERLMEGKGMPLQYRGAMTIVLNWLESLPKKVLDARPSLWVAYASALTMAGKPGNNIEKILQVVETNLPNDRQDERIRDLIGQVAAIRAMLGIPRNQVETIIAQSRRALEYLHPDNLSVRTTTTWTLGYAYQIQGDLINAGRAFTEAISTSRTSDNIMITLAATTSLGQVQEAENQLYLAAESYKRVLQLVGDPPWPAACEADLGLARVCYQWNDLEAAEHHGLQSLRLARQMENVGTTAECEVFLGLLRLAQEDFAGADAFLAEADQFVRQRNFGKLMPEVVGAQVHSLLRQDNLAAAAHLAEKYELPVSQARSHQASGDPATALILLEPLRLKAEAKGLENERLELIILEAIAHHTLGEEGKAVQLLTESLALAEPGGFIRIFVNEGPPMEALLQKAAKRGDNSSYLHKILAAFRKSEEKIPVAQLLIEPLSERELDVVRLLSTELDGPEIARELMVSLNTMRTHTKNIYNKLGVSNRHAAVRRAKDLKLL